MNPLLQVKNLSVDFISSNRGNRESAGGTSMPAVRNVSFTVNRGEIVAIVGESGSGKTVTALSILQLLPCPPARYTSGKIFFSDDERSTENLLTKTGKQLRNIRGNKIGIIFQEPMTSLNPVFSCGHQVAEALRSHKTLSRVAAKREAIEWFTKVRLPDAKGIFNRYPHQLSGGQKQRVMIAMAMCCHPSLLICDEPTTALDVTVQKTILSLIRDLQRGEDMGVIFITHDLGVVGEIADRALVMFKGEIVEQKPTSEIFRAPQHPYTKALLACRPVNHKQGERLPVVSDFLTATIHDIARPRVTPIALNNLPPAQLNETRGTQKHTWPLVEVKNLSVQFPAGRTLFGRPLTFLRAVDDVSFEVYNGETLGLVGESGCGKTTLGRALLRLIEPTSGSVTYNGTDLASISPTELKKLRTQIQIVFQDPYSSLNPRLTIGSAIGEALKVHSVTPGKRRREQHVVDLLEKVGLSPQHFGRFPHEFSGGQRQRIVIARALALSPSFIVCDEPVSSLDVSVQAQVLNLLNDLKNEFNFTIVFISHDLSVVRYLSNRIIVMNKGKIEESGSTEEIYLHPKKQYTKNLVNAIPKAPG